MGADCPCDNFRSSWIYHACLVGLPPFVFAEPLMNLNTAIKRVQEFRDFIESRPELGVIFQEPATKRQIKQFESQYDWEFEPEVRALLLVFNGEDSRRSRGSCAGYNFCSMEMMLSVFGMGEDCANQFHRPPHYAPFLTQENSWRPDWMPIAETQLGCNAVYIDYLPSKHGKVGQIFSRADSHDISGVKAVGVMNLLDIISAHVEKHNEMPYFDTGLPSILKTS